jgi:hypothetical protein
MPEILHAALVLMFFSKIKSMRIFNGESIYGIIAKATNAADSLNAHLALVNSDLRELLAKSYPSVQQTLLSSTVTDSTIDIELTIKTTDEEFNGIVYTYKS